MPRANLILFTPGPVRIPAIVAEHMADPPCNYHRQEGFRQMFAATEAKLKALVGIKDAGAYFATLITATGTGANEGCLLALAALGKGLILRNGFFAARLVDQAVQDGLDHAVLDAPGDRPIDPAAVDEALARDPSIRWVYFVSHETRAGLANPTVEIGRVAKRRGLFVGADVVSHAYAYPLDIEAAGLDLAVTTSAKAIMAAPGIGIVFCRNESMPALARVGRRGYYLDVVAEYAKQRKELQTRFAQPVALHAALHAACLHLEAQGIDAHMGRVRRQMDAIIAHLAQLGITPQLDPAFRSNIAVNFGLPPGLEYPEFAERMEARGYYLLYGIPGDLSHFQVSTIGDLADEHVDGLNAAFTHVLAAATSRHARPAASAS